MNDSPCYEKQENIQGDRLKCHLSSSYYIVLEGTELADGFFSLSENRFSLTKNGKKQLLNTLFQKQTKVIQKRQNHIPLNGLQLQNCPLKSEWKHISNCNSIYLQLKPISVLSLLVARIIADDKKKMSGHCMLTPPFFFGEAVGNGLDTLGVQRSDFYNIRDTIPHCLVRGSMP